MLKRNRATGPMVTDAPTGRTTTMTETTEYPTFSGFPVDVWEEGMQKAEAVIVGEFAEAEFRGFVTTDDGELLPSVVIPRHEMDLTLTSAEWGAVHWLLTEQATMMWTVSRQLKNSSPELRAQAAWWKSLEVKVAAAIDDVASIGPLDILVSEGMAEQAVTV